MVLRGQPRIGYSTGMTTPQMVACLVLIPPKILKPPRRQFGILHRMLDVTMAQEELDRPRILLVVGQLIAAPMPELMRMHREPQPGALTRLGHHLAHTRIGQRPFALREKHISRRACQALEFPQRTHLRPGQRVRARDAVLDAPDVQESVIEIELISAQGNQFRHAQPMAIGQEDHCRVAVSVASEAARGLLQLGDLRWREMLTGTDLRMFMTLGKGELGHLDLLAEELSCFRCLDPANPGSAA